MSKYDFGDVQHFGNVRIEGDLTTNGRVHDIITVTNANYTALTTDEIILFSTGGTARTVSLPQGTAHAGRTYLIKKIDAGVGTVTISAASGNIEGAGTLVIAATQYKFARVVSDGTNYFVIGSN